MAVVRISRGWFEASQLTQVSQMLQDGAEQLVPAIKALPGLLEYHVGIDANTNSMTNTSIWIDEGAAQQMAILPEMLAQRDLFVAAGIRFDPIANYLPLWTITP
jgi:quinol monooxygenase YgiN